MTLPALPPPTLIEDQAGIEALLADLEDEKEIAFDTEADSFYSYRNKVCLIQVTARGRDYLVDPLAGLDLSGLGPILADERRVKVFHDGEYDVLILKRDFGFEFRNIFDTRVAAAVLGSTSPGLAAVLEDHFGVQLDKSMQRSDWAKRPLTPKQVDYARLDTHYLIPLFHEQRAKLAERGRAHIVASECRRLESLEAPEFTSDPDEFVRIKGARALSPTERTSLRAVFALREALASESDVPPFRIINNTTMLEIAQVDPRDIRRLTQIKGFTPRMARRFGDALLEALETARSEPGIKKLPQGHKRDGTEVLDEAGLELFDRLKRWRKQVSERLGVESAYLVNRLVLVEIARTRPRTLDALERVKGIQDWQLAEYGEDLLATVAAFEAEYVAGTPSKRRRWRS